MPKILAIDDDDVALEVMNVTLTSMGYTVFKALDSGSGAISALHNQPDVIISDFMLPGRAGISIFAELASNPKTASIPVLVVSGMPLQQIQTYLPTEIWCKGHFMSKPVDYEKLHEKIQELLKQKAQPPTQAG